jgi:polyhydroxybutyrate depolymerase
LAAETTTEEVFFGGYTREYFMSAPAARRQLPTVLALHGSFLNAQRLLISLGLEPLVDREGLVAVYPNAIGAQWNDGRAASAVWTGGLVDDVAFIRSLVEHLVRSGVSDPRRVYVAGYSNGGMMTLRLICDAPELVAAAAIIAASFPREVAQSCTPARPTPILVMNGTADPIVPYQGGGLAFGAGDVLPTEEMLSFFRRVNRCAEAAKVGGLPDVDRDDGSYVTIASWTSCPSAAQVMLYRIEGGGHRIPSHREDWPVADVVLGRMNHDFEAADAIWSFFKDKRR